MPPDISCCTQVYLRGACESRQSSRPQARPGGGGELGEDAGWPQRHLETLVLPSSELSSIPQILRPKRIQRCEWAISVAVLYRQADFISLLFISAPC